jgi:hypothetical protein
MDVAATAKKSPCGGQGDSLAFDCDDYPRESIEESELVTALAKSLARYRARRTRVPPEASPTPRLRT